MTKLTEWLRPTRILRRVRFATTIVLYILIPGGSAMLLPWLQRSQDCLSPEGGRDT
jgi:antibiotic biosynthesis monooxygenase (ABM) superfamily enzyme